MKNLIIIGVLLYVFSRKSETPATTTVTTTTPPTPKKTPVIIENGGTGGGGGTTQTGAYLFEFFQQNGNASDITVHLVSHSRVATPVGETQPNATATCEYWLYGPNNELVVHVKDNVGGHHPNFFDAGQMANASQALKDRINFCIQNFNAVYPFSNYQERGNNHNAYFNRTLKTGSYRWVYHNTSNTDHTLFAGYTDSETENVQLHLVSTAGSFNEYSIEIALHPSDTNTPFKFNTNNYTV